MLQIMRKARRIVRIVFAAGADGYHGLDSRLRFIDAEIDLHAVLQLIEMGIQRVVRKRKELLEQVSTCRMHLSTPRAARQLRYDRHLARRIFGLCKSKAYISQRDDQKNCESAKRFHTSK